MTSELPLSGIRIADFSWVLAGPHCTKWLGAMGAEVIKVESHFRPDRFRGVAPFIGDTESIDSSIAWNMLNYSKKDCTINLGTAKGQELAQDLVERSDVVIENFSAGVAERLGLDYSVLSKRNPKLVMVSSSGVGRTGPDAGMRAFGKSIHAFAGQTYLTRWPHTPPRGVGGTWTDPITGVTSALAILAALEFVATGGDGVHLDLSMAEATMALLAEPFLEFLNDSHEAEPTGNYDPSLLIHDSFQTLDGGWVAIAAHSEREESGLRQLLQDHQCPATREELEASLRRFCGTINRDTILAELERLGVCAVPVFSFDELESSPQYVSRSLAQRLVNDGVGAYTAMKLPWTQSPSTPFVYTPAPKLGEDNRYVLESILDLSEDIVEDLLQSDAMM
ncbi:MAG: CaiB/BaiF CoA transferase family protein [Dehalococcoidia bacterium]